MFNLERDHVPRLPSTETSGVSTNAIAYADTVAAYFKKLESGYRDGLYKFFQQSLIAYRKFLKDPTGYDELLRLDYIGSLREKPDVKKTSRLVLYRLTDAQTTEKRNIAGRYARVVDYLHKEGIKSSDAADHVRDEGGMDAILNKARDRDAPKVANEDVDDMLRGDAGDFDQDEDSNEAGAGASESMDGTDELFDPCLDLAIRVTPKVRARVLGESLPADKAFYLTCKKTRVLPGGRVRIVGRLPPPRT